MLARHNSTTMLINPCQLGFGIIHINTPMRKWIDLCEEAATAIPDYLYHGTSLLGLLCILHEDVMMGGEDDNGGEGVFCSPRKEVAARYVTYATRPAPNGGIIILDTKKLMSNPNIAITPYEYHDGVDGQEYTLTEGYSIDIVNASRFIHDIEMKREDYEAAKEFLTEDDPLKLFQGDPYAVHKPEDFLPTVERFLNLDITIT
jgi:hypothetical protein